MKKKVKKKVVKKSAKKVDKSGLAFRLDGQVSLVEFDKDGNETVSPLDGKTVLQCLITCLTEGLDLMENKK